MAKSKDKEPPVDGDEAAVDGEGAPAKKKPPLKLLIIAGVGALVVLGGGGAGAFMLLKPKPAAEGEAHAEKDKKAEKVKEEKGKEGEAPESPAVIRPGPDGVVFYTMPDIVVNMQTPEGKATFLKLRLTLELPDEAVASELDPNLPRLQDMFQTFLRELRPEDLSGSQGSYQLRMEILRRVNLVISPAKVNAVLIEEMLIN
ncbi:MAG: flagellar basal body protein FliL [Caulobacterales bacterium 32-67-6]|nr:MAG: flagellar basal body protein FliL [Caulobacterales bacterium 32-67-6]